MHECERAVRGAAVILRARPGLDPGAGNVRPAARPLSSFLRVQFSTERGERAIDVEEDDDLLPGIARFGFEAIVAVTLRMDERLARWLQFQQSQDAVLLGDLDHDERRASTCTKLTAKMLSALATTAAQSARR